MPRPRAALAVLLAFVPWLAACAPTVAPPGPGSGAPALSEGAPHGIAPEAGEGETGAELMTFVTRDGYELLLRRWRPAEEPVAIVLALHGFNDHSTFLAAAAEAWTERGIATYAYDQRGFGTAPHRGLWAGTTAYTQDAADALTVLAEQYPGKPIYLLGESMGGAIALVTLTRHPEVSVDGAILSAPAVWARDTMPFYQRWGLFLASYTVPWLELTGRDLDIQASDNIDALIALGRDPLVIKATRIDAMHGLSDLMDEALAAAPRFQRSALLLYGEKDELVPQDPMLQLWQHLPPAAAAHQRRVLYQNGWHLLFKDLQAQLVIDDVAHWIADQAAPLPSAADQEAEERLLALDH
ncbi:MAG TPA: lysophospholipase [Kiloniellales bacterium]|nr:lysophospholipase [Kiloniellales bacterium]